MIVFNNRFALKASAIVQIATCWCRASCRWLCRHMEISSSSSFRFDSFPCLIACIQSHGEKLVAWSVVFLSSMYTYAGRARSCSCFAASCSSRLHRSKRYQLRQSWLQSRQTRWGSGVVFKRAVQAFQTCTECDVHLVWPETGWSLDGLREMVS